MVEVSLRCRNHGCNEEQSSSTAEGVIIDREPFIRILGKDRKDRAPLLLPRYITILLREECEQYLQGINQDTTLENWSWLYVRMKHILEVAALIHELGFTTTID